MIAIPAAYRTADTLAGPATQPWCASVTAPGTDRASFAVIHSRMRLFIAHQADQWASVAARPAPRMTASGDSHAIQSA
jgi:hypothetical protein